MGKKKYEPYSNPDIPYGSVYDKQHFTEDELRKGGDIIEAARAGETSWDEAHNYWEGNRNRYGYSGGDDGAAYIPTGKFSYEAAPQYVNRYQDKINSLMAAIQNRGPFTWDPKNDVGVQQYTKQYRREGERAMQDTMGQAAAMTGGIPSTYAMAAAQQANNYYNAKMSDKIPELRQLAYNMYLDEGADIRKNLSMLMQAEQGDYGKYVDSLGQYNKDRSFAYGNYRDAIGDRRYEDETGYNRGRDALADSLRERDWQHGLDREAVEDDRWNKQWDYQKQRDAVSDSHWKQEQDRLWYAARKKVDGSGKDDAEIISGTPSFNFDPDEGIYSFNGQDYNTVEALQSAIENTAMTEEQFNALLNKLKLFGIPVTVE